MSFQGYECRLITLTFSSLGNVHKPDFSNLKRSKTWLCGQREYCVYAIMYLLVLNEVLNMCVIPDEPGGEARGADPGPGVSAEAEGQLAAETQHAAAQQRHAVPAAARRPRRSQ